MNYAQNLSEAEEAASGTLEADQSLSTNTKEPGKGTVEAGKAELEAEAINEIEGDEEANGQEDGEKVTVIKERLESLGAQAQEELEVAELARRFETIKTSLAQVVVAPPDDPKAQGGVPLRAVRSRSRTPLADEDEITSQSPENFTENLKEFQYVDFVKRQNPQESPTFRLLVRNHFFYLYLF